MRGVSHSAGARAAGAAGSVRSFPGSAPCARAESSNRSSCSGGQAEQADRRGNEDEPANCGEVVRAIREPGARRVVRRIPTRTAAEHRRGTDRGDGEQDAAKQAARGDAVELSRVGGNDGTVEVDSAAGVVGLWAAATPPGVVQTIHRPVLHREVAVFVGLYLNPPQKALVLCVDEKSQCQALERTQPMLPMGLGYVEGVTRDYVRHGTTTLFVALDIANGQVLTQNKSRHRHQEFLGFLRRIDANVPADLDVLSCWTTTQRINMPSSKGGLHATLGITLTSPPPTPLG